MSARFAPARPARRPALAARRRTALLGALPVALLAAVAAAVVLPGSSRSPAIRPLRVTADTGIATGFAVGPDRVVTVAHAVAGRPVVTVRAGSRRLRAHVLRADRRSDLALLAVPGLRARGIETAGPQTAGSPASGDLRLVRLREGPSELSVHVRRAIVAHVRGPGDTTAVRRPALELGARVRPGDSGAPLVTDSGALAGVVFGASRRRAGTAYAVDAGELARLLRR